jgi:hypothetical protein
MKLRDLQTDPLLAAMYTHDMWSQLAENGSNDKGSAVNLPVDQKSLLNMCGICEHFDDHPEEKSTDCRNCYKFMRWIPCFFAGALYYNWKRADNKKDKAYYAKLIADKAMEAAIRYIEEYKD